MSQNPARIDPYQLVTDQIVGHLERGVVPWRKPWRVSVGRPRNFHTGKPYHGVNALLLGWAQYESPWWMTFRQVAERGGSIRKGEHGAPIMKWGSYLPAEKPAREADEQKPRYYLRSYRVFNAAQIEKIDFPAKEEAPQIEGEPIPAAEAVYENMPQKPKLRTSRRNRAAYNWKKDEVEMPARGRFDAPESYHLTLFHELVHSTGHPTRLDRKGVTESDGFGGKVYSQEELTAEMGAAFLAAEANVETHGHEQSAAYVKEWLDALREPDHRRWLVLAANQAGRAAEFILGRLDPTKTEEPSTTESEEPAAP